MIQLVLASDRPLLESAMAIAQNQVRRIIETYPGFHPMYTAHGHWKHDGAVWTDWCDGFLPGMMWLFRRYETERGGKHAQWWMKQAIAYTKPLESRKNDQDTHDHGMILLPTYYRWFQVEKDPKLEAVLVEAGRTLALRFREKGQYLCSFIADDSLFIDIMMNVGIIFLAARVSGDKGLHSIALRHSLTTRRYLVRGDGSTAHEGIFDTDTGEFLREATQQGYRADTCWARGLAWAIYGFTTCYEYSGDPHFLETAVRCADYYITHCPADGICPWDFNAPADSRRQVDTSAAAITASGLLRLSRHLQDTVKGHFYSSTGAFIVRNLCAKYLAEPDSDWEGILKGGVYHMSKNWGVNESVIWGDYFFVDALVNTLRIVPGGPKVN